MTERFLDEIFNDFMAISQNAGARANDEADEKWDNKYNRLWN